MRAVMTAFATLAVLSSAACDSERTKQAVGAEEIEALSPGKGDGLSSMTVGSLVYGQTSALVTYSAPPDYRMFSFEAHAGDTVDVSVTSTTGDAIAWVVDDDFEVLGMNDDATSSTLNSKIHLEIPAHPSSRHYVIFRDYDHLYAKFRVRLDGTSPDCAKDSQCEMVESGCCAVGDFVAVPSSDVAAFEAAKNCSPNQNCPLVPIQDHGAQALCEVSTATCQIFLPSEIACGGKSTTAHVCPDGWTCRGDALAWDGPGECVQFCGGPSHHACSGGLTCVDDTTDSCQPSSFTPSCIGICI